MDTLAFGYILPTTGRIRDFDPLETCAARRTIKEDLSVILNEKSSFSVESVISQPLLFLSPGLLAF